MVNFPAPQKLDPKISSHGTHTNYLWQCLWGRKIDHFLPHKKTRPQAPKSSQNRGIFDVYAKPKTTSVAKTPLFATLSQNNMSEMLYLTVFLDYHRKYQRIQRLHFPWQQATKSKNTDMYSVSAQWFLQKKVLFGQFLAFEASQNKEGGTPPPLPHLKF